MEQHANRTKRGTWVRALIWIGISILALALLIILMAVVAVETYTDSGPVPLPQPPAFTEEQAEQLRARVTAFQQALRQQRSTGPLVLTADEINTLIQSDPAFRILRGRFYIELPDSKPAARMSLPLQELHVPFLSGRYLNATATFNITVMNGTVTVNPVDIRVKGHRPPGLIMSRLRRRNLAEKVNDDPRASLALEKLQSIQVVDGKVVVTPKPPE